MTQVFLNPDGDDEDEALEDLHPVVVAPPQPSDYFTAYKQRPQWWNPNNKLGDFHTGTPLFKSVEELEGRLKDYLNNALKQGQPLTISGMANAIGVNRKQFMEYRDWYKNTQSEEDALFGIQVNRIISAAIAICEQYAEEKLFDGRMKPQGIIFQMVNNFGWRNKLDVEANTNSEELSEIRSAYQALLEKKEEKQKNAPTG